MDSRLAMATQAPTAPIPGIEKHLTTINSCTELVRELTIRVRNVCDVLYGPSPAKEPATPISGAHIEGHLQVLGAHLNELARAVNQLEVGSNN